MQLWRAAVSCKKKAKKKSPVLRVSILDKRKERGGEKERESEREREQNRVKRERKTA